MHQSRQSLQHSMGSRTSMLSCFRSHRSSGWAADQIQFGGQKKLLEPVCCMSNIFSVFQSSSTDSTCRQKKRLEPLLHVKYFQFSIVAVQIQPAGKKLLEPVCCMSNIFSFPQQLYRFNLGAKKNGWNLFVACQISSVFHSSCTDSTCWQKKGLEPVCCMSNIFSFPQQLYRFNVQGKKLLEPVCCMSNIFSFPQQLYRFNLGAKKGLEPLLHVKYFQFSIVAVQIQLAGKNCWNLFVACQIFSVFHSSSTDSTYRQKKTVGTCLLHVKYFQFSTVAVQIQLAGKKTVGTCLLHVKYFQFSKAAVQIQLGKKTVGTCLLHVKYFQFSTATVQIQPGGKKKRLEPVLHVKYFQFSIVAVQIQPAGKKTVGTCLLHVKYFQFC